MMLKFEKNSFAGRIMSLHDKKGVALALTLIRPVSSIYKKGRHAFGSLQFFAFA